MDLNDITALFKEKDAFQEKVFTYYNGEHMISRPPAALDGRDQNIYTSNWVKYITDQTTGFVFGEPIDYISQESEEVQNLKEVLRNNNVDKIDFKNFQNCVLYGQSVEVVSFTEENKIKIKNFAPFNWRFQFDLDDNLLLAVYQIELESTVLYHIYDDERIMIVEGQKVGRTVANHNIIEEKEHFLGMIPVVLYSIDDFFKSFITDNILGLSDSYNLTASILLDDTQYNFDSLLAITGYDPNSLLQKDEHGVSLIQKLRANRILALDGEGAEAEFLSKGNEIAKYIETLSTIRKDIYQSASLPDIEEITGANGSTSGIALRLRFQPQAIMANKSKNYFNEGLRRRIDVINIIWNRLGLSQLEDYEIIWTYNLQHNLIELYTALDLKSVLSKKDILSLIPGIDVDSALENLQEEKGNQPRVEPIQEPIEENINEEIEE